MTHSRLLSHCPIVFVLATTVTLFGCKTIKELTDPGPPPVATSIQLSQSAVALTALGAQATVSATVKDQNGNTMSGVSVTWSSSPASVATVNSSGTITAVGVGSATVTATSGSLSESTSVTVTQEPAAVALLSGDQQSATVGATLSSDLALQVNDAGGNPIGGVDVSFAVVQGGGSLSDAELTTDAGGQASTTWTLGTDAGTQAVSASAGDASSTFTATALPDAPDSLAKVSGDGQTGLAGDKLDNPIVVAVLDQYGNGVPGVDVDFTVESGGGSLDSSSTTTDAAGEARTGWTMGSSTGSNTASASSPGLNGDPVAFSATATDLSVSGISPNPIVEGGTATISGTGFSPVPANNTVVIDGIAVSVTAATTTQLDVTVPVFDCRPARAVDVTVTVSSTTTSPENHQLEPASFLSLAVGEQLVIQDPASFCLQFDPELNLEEYVIGVQSTSEVASSLTEVVLSGEKDPAATSSRAGAPRAQTASRGDFQPTARARRLGRHRNAEAAIRARDLAWLRSLDRRHWVATRGMTGAAASVDSGAAVGDTLTLRVRAQGDASCQNADSVRAVVKVKGQKGFWLDDVDNPANGFSEADYQTLSDQFDGLIYPSDFEHFGDPGDIDSNGRIVVLITKEVNKRFPTLGFASSCDMLDSDSFGASNEAEIFYGAAPDPTGSVNDSYSRDDAFEDAPFIIAHELAHVIQLGRRGAAGAPFPTAWELEGQATLAEEVTGHAFEGRTTGQNLGYDVAFNNDDPSSIDWYSNAFVDLAYFYGYESSNSRVAGAPEQCSWLDASFQAPCGGRPLWYGVSWSFLRWISDHFGDAFAGGEKGFHQALIDASDVGFTNIANRVGVPIDSLLAQWSASLWVDDRVSTSNDRLTMRSWDLLDIFNGLVSTARLQPGAASFDDFSRTLSVRAASTAYTLVSGLLRPAVAIRARDAAGGALPSQMQLYVVRTR